MRIFATGYLDNGAFYFNEVTKDNEETNKDGGEAETVFDLKKETKKKSFM